MDIYQPLKSHPKNIQQAPYNNKPAASVPRSGRSRARGWGVLNSDPLPPQLSSFAAKGGGTCRFSPSNSQRHIAAYLWSSKTWYNLEQWMYKYKAGVTQQYPARLLGEGFITKSVQKSMKIQLLPLSNPNVKLVHAVLYVNFLTQRVPNNAKPIVVHVTKVCTLEIECKKNALDMATYDDSFFLHKPYKCVCQAHKRTCRT